MCYCCYCLFPPNPTWADQPRENDQTKKTEKKNHLQGCRPQLEVAVVKIPRNLGTRVIICQVVYITNSHHCLLQFWDKLLCRLERQRYKLYKFFWAMSTRNVFKTNLMPPGPRVGWLYDFLCSFRAGSSAATYTHTTVLSGLRRPKESVTEGDDFLELKIAIPAINFWSINLRIMNIRVGN